MRALLTAIAIFVSSNASAADWPRDAQIKSHATANPRIRIQKVEFVRTCEGDDASIRFTFVYPRFAQKHAALGAVNAALKANIQGREELDPCVAVAPLPIPSTGEERVEEE